MKTNKKAFRFFNNLESTNFTRSSSPKLSLMRFFTRLLSFWMRKWQKVAQIKSLFLSLW